MNCPIAWTAAQICRLAQSGIRPPDRFERAAEWVRGMRRPVTWGELAKAHDISRMEAMRRLREATQRGLLRRIASENPNRPDEFVAPDLARPI